MKLVAVTVGITLLGAQVFAAEPKRSQGESSATFDKSATTPQTPEGTRKIPPVEEPSAEPLPPGVATTSLSGKDVEFLMTAYENGRLLAWIGETAARRAQNAHVRMMGMSLQRTVTEENEELLQLAKKHSVKIDPAKSPVQQSKMASELPKAEGPELDKAFTIDVLAAAQKAVAVYEQGVKSEDKEIRSFAERMLPKAKERLEHADTVSRTVPATGTPAL